MQYHVYLTTPTLESPRRELSQYFETPTDAERYYSDLVRGGEFEYLLYILILEKTDPRTILKRHDFSKMTKT